MLFDEPKLLEQIEWVTDDRIRQTYLVFAHAQLPYGYTIRPTNHGYIERELRIEQGHDWLFSAVLNKRWVLWYFRKPALKLGLLDAETTLARFQGAQMTGKGEISLRVTDPNTATMIVQWIWKPSLATS